jgi:hypothetical protein
VLKALRRLSPQERWTSLYAPLLVAFFSGGVLALAVTVGAPGVASLFTDNGPRLTLVDVDLRVPIARAARDSPKPRLEVKLYNEGDGRAVISRASFQIVDVADLEWCPDFAGSGTGLTGRYSVHLPTDGSVGQIQSRRVHQDLGPDEADRFSFIFETPDLEPPTVKIYSLDASLTYHGAEEPLEVGRIVVVTPGALAPAEFPYYLARVRQGRRIARETGVVLLPGSARCWRENRRRLARVVASDGQLTPTVERMANYLRHG